METIKWRTQTATSNNPPYEPTRKKLIEYGWDVPYPDFVRRNIRQMEERDFFDGIVIRLRGGWRNSANLFRLTPVDPQEYQDDLAHLRALEFKKFTHNFILLWGTAEPGWDWFHPNHWRSVEHNARLIAKTAKASNCVGLCYDPEPYNANPWSYKDAPHAKAKSFQEYEQRVRRCGAKFIQTLQRELPTMRLLTFFQLSLFRALIETPNAEERTHQLSQHHYALLPAFLNGMLDALKPTVTIIDGNEPAYYYSTQEQYLDAYHLMRNRALTLIAPENRRKYVAQVQAGYALYIDWCFGLWPPERRIVGHFLAPEDQARWFEHNVYHALRTTDEYVWCYSEKVDWWGTQQKQEWFRKVPSGAEEAIRSAKQKVSLRQPLGFSIQGALQEAQKRMEAERGKR